MTVLLAIVITAVVVGASTAMIARYSVRETLVRAVGGRTREDPVEAYRRLLTQATSDVAQEANRAELLRRSLDALTAGVIVTDSAGNVVVRNRLAEAAATRSHEQTLIDSTVSELLSLSLQGQGTDREVAIFGPPSRVLFVHAVPIKADERVVGALAVIDDVTDHHRIEKTRRDFVANLSHELRTPVGAVSLLAEMVVDESDSTTRAQLTDRLLAEADRMSATIDDLLELSRIESEAQVYDEIFVVQEVVDEALARLRVMADATNVALGAIAPTEPITVTGNRDQVLVALVNLVENAVKYSSPGDTVCVRSRVDGEMLSLIVQDTGRGIPSRDLDRIFERFYRVDRSRDSTTGGTGIGLSIVRHVAINHGGTVSVESFEGDGSTFTVCLPLLVVQPVMQDGTNETN